MATPSGSPPLPTVHAATVSALAAAAGLSAPVAAAPVSAASGPFSVSAAPHGFVVGAAAALVSYDAAFDAVSAATARVRSELELTYAELRQQGRGWYRLSLASATVGFGIIALAVIALILGNVTTGLVTTASSVVPNAIASLFFVQARRADRRLDAVTQELSKSREAYALLEIANTIPRTINDLRLRNEIVAEILRKVIAK